MLETLDFTTRIGSTPTFLYLDLYFNTAYAAHNIYCTNDQYVCFNYAIFTRFNTEILGSIVVSIPACHAGDRGSIPRRGGLFFPIFLLQLYKPNF